MKQALFLCTLVLAAASVVQAEKPKEVTCRTQDDVFQIQPDGKYYVYNLDKAKTELNENPPAHNPICLPPDSARMIWYTDDGQKQVKVKSITPAPGSDASCGADNGKPFRDDPRNAKASKFIVSDVAQADFYGCSYEVHLQYANGSGDPHIYMGGGGTKLDVLLKQAQEEVKFWQNQVKVLEEKLQAPPAAQSTQEEK